MALKYSATGCVPVVVFYLPDGCTFDGVIDLDPQVADLLGQSGHILALSQPRTGIIYILGDSFSMRNTGATSRATDAGEKGEYAAPAAESDSGSAAAPADERSGEPTEEPSDEPANGPSDKPSDDSKDEPADGPEDPPAPEPEPVDERTPLEIFADKYKGNYKNIDWASEVENLGGDIDEIDWNELIRLVGYKNFSVIQFNSGLKAYYTSVHDDPYAYDDLFWELYDVQSEFLDDKSEYAESAPDSLVKHIQWKDRQVALSIYDHDDLQSLVDVLIHRVQPKAINLLMSNFQAFGGAGADAFSASTGLKIANSQASAYGVMEPQYAEGGDVGTRITMTLEFLKSDYDGNVEHIDSFNLDDEIIYTIVHENMHLIMFDYNRPLLNNYVGIPIFCDDNWNYSYHTPDYGILNDDEFMALIDAKFAPGWFYEGIANAVGGYYATPNYNKGLRAAAVETEDGVFYEADKLVEEFTGMVNSLYNPRSRTTANFCYGPIAVMYLGELVLRHDGDTSITRDESGQVTRIDSRAISAGVSTLVDSLHTGESLDQLVARYSDGTYANADDFGRRYIVGNETGRDEDSLQFTVDILNYFEKISREQGKLVSGSILVDFEDSLMNYINSDGEASSPYYNFTDSLDYAPSDVSTESTLSQGGKSEFDMEKYREEQKEGSEELLGAGVKAAEAEESDARAAKAEESDVKAGEVKATEEKASEAAEKVPTASSGSTQVEEAEASSTESTQAEEAEAVSPESVQEETEAASTESVHEEVEAASTESVHEEEAAVSSESAQVEEASVAASESVEVEEVPAA